MTATFAAKPPWHLWLVALLAILFNVIGVFDFTMSMARGAAYQASAGMTPAQIAHYQAMPGWMIVLWGIGVFGAFAGSLLIALRRRAAAPVLAVSLAAFLLSLVYHYLLSDGFRLMGPQMLATDAVIAGELLLLIWYARAMTARGVLR